MKISNYIFLFLVLITILSSGCTTMEEKDSLNNSNDDNNQKNPQIKNSSILSTNIISKNGIDGTLSAAGYTKFKEKPKNDTLSIIQSFVNVGKSCKSSRIKVTPRSDSNDETIKVTIEAAKNKIDKECIGTNNNPINSTGIQIKFKSLKPGQKIQFTYDQIKFSYETKGEKNTATREIKVPDNIR